MKLSLNLSSRRYVNQHALKQLYLLLCLLLIMLLIFQIKSYLQSRGEIAKVEQNLRELQQQHGRAPAERLTDEQIKMQQQEYSQARDWLQRDAFRWTALFDRLEKRLPDGVSIRSFNPDYKQKSLMLTGVARKLSDLQALLDNLHTDDFQQVFLQSQSRVDVSDGSGGKKKALSFSLKLEGVF